MRWPSPASDRDLPVVRDEGHDVRWPSAFISHASHDGTDHAARLDRTLRRHGVVTWLCDRDVDVSLDFTSELEQAIDAANAFIACITLAVMRPDSYVRREICYAQMLGKRIAVARFAPILPPISVVTNTYFEFHLGWDAAFARLLVFCRNSQDLSAPVPTS